MKAGFPEADSGRAFPLFARFSAEKVKRALDQYLVTATGKRELRRVLSMLNSAPLEQINRPEPLWNTDRREWAYACRWCEDTGLVPCVAVAFGHNYEMARFCNRCDLGRQMGAAWDEKVGVRSGARTTREFASWWDWRDYRGLISAYDKPELIKSGLIMVEYAPPIENATTGLPDGQESVL